MSMDMTGLGSMAAALNKQAFGAAVVSKTLDHMNNAGPSTAPVDAQSFGAAVVGKTMDYMNSGKGSGASSMSQTYDFAKDVLSAYAVGQGALVNMKV